MVRTTLFFLFANAAFSQIAFEVASVRPTPPPAPNARQFFGPPRGGPGTSDPEQITWENAALRNILMTAYDVPTFQVTAPEWTSTTRYDIAAKVPPGTTKEQVNAMWQTLLKERFGLVLHHESKEFSVDQMTVAKGGLKIKKTDLDPNAEPFTPSGVTNGKDGPTMNGTGMIITIFPGTNGPTARMTAKGLSLPEIALKLGQNLRHPVIDMTGVGGKYDFTLEYTPDISGMPLPPGAPASPADSAREPASSIAYAVEKQLGLKLTAGKSKLDVIVVDHAEKTPTEN
jgi:uncharacterized protein (TIGR03435 family)